MPSSLKPTRGGGGGHRGVISAKMKGVIVNQTGGRRQTLSRASTLNGSSFVFGVEKPTVGEENSKREDATIPRRIKGSIGGLSAQQNAVVEQRQRKLQRRFITNNCSCYSNVARLHVQVTFCGSRGSLPRDLDTCDVKQS